MVALAAKRLSGGQAVVGTWSIRWAGRRGDDDPDERRGRRRRAPSQPTRGRAARAAPSLVSSPRRGCVADAAHGCDQLRSAVSSLRRRERCRSSTTTAVTAESRSARRGRGYAPSRAPGLVKRSSAAGCTRWATARLRPRRGSPGERRVHLQVVATEHVAIEPGLPGAPQHGRRASHSSSRLNGLEVVVTAHRQAAHLVLGGIAGGEEQDRACGPPTPHPPTTHRTRRGRGASRRARTSRAPFGHRGKRLAARACRRHLEAVMARGRPSIERRFSSSSTTAGALRPCPHSPGDPGSWLRTR